MIFGGAITKVFKKRQMRRLVLKLRKGIDVTDLLKSGCLPMCKYYEVCEKGKNKSFAETEHHLYFPKPWYLTDIDQGFRELPQNKIVLCRHWHDKVHYYLSPPKKPSFKKIIKELKQSDIEKTNKKLYRIISKHFE